MHWSTVEPNRTAAARGRERERDVALGIIAAGVILAILYWARIVFITVISALIVALILEPFVGFLVRLRLPRTIATLLVCSFAVLALYFAGFTAWRQISVMAGDVPTIKEHMAQTIGGISDNIQRMEDSVSRVLIPRRQQAAAQQQPAQSSKNKKDTKKGPIPLVILPPPPELIPEVRIHEDKNPIGDYIYAQLPALYEYALMASFVPLLVFFMLSWRDHAYKSFLRFFDGAGRITAARSVEGIASMARAFVVGNFMIGVLLAFVSWALFAAIKIPYPSLVGAISGFLSLIPYAGIVLAAFPPILAALAAGADNPTLLFALAIAVGLHLFAMNVLYPTLVGARVHLNPLIVTLSLVFWAFLWDAAGLLLAIPITAGLKAVCDNVAGLHKIGRFLGD